jgi:coatomer subunit beta'
MAILSKDFELAEKLLPKIPESFNESIIKFLEKFELYDLCYKITKNQNQKFSLAIKLKKLSEAYEIATTSKNSEKLKMVSDLAIELGEFNFAEKTMKEGHDWNGLLLYYSSIQNRKKLKEFADEAKKAGMFNVAFGSYFQLNCYNECLNILLDSRRYPEAATFSRTYLPSKVEEVIEIWNKQIEEEDKNNRTTMKIISPINKHNEESLTLTENLFKEFYAGLDDEKNKLNQGNINNFQGFDFFKEINDGKKVKLDDVIGAKIETKKIIEEKSSKTEEDKKEEKVEKKPGEEEEDEGEDDEEGGEEDDNEENK